MKIYCEGTRHSHDYALLQKIKGDLDMDIQPIGSKIGAESVIDDFENQGKKPESFVFFRDRDFDVSVPEMPSLLIQNSTIYSYRTTIENYLLNTRLFFSFLQEKKIENKFKIHSIADAQTIFIKAAKKISYYQALRHTIAQLRLSTDLGTSWLKGNSGSLPTYLEDKRMCRQKAFEKVKEGYEGIEAPSEMAFDTVLNTFCKRFEKDDFYEKEQYLIWFQGKDLSKALTHILPHFPLAHYYRFAKKHFDFMQFEDLVELREILAQNTEGSLYF